MLKFLYIGCLILAFQPDIICQRAIPSVPQSQKTKKDKSSFKNVFEGQPGRAALYSLILPGAGQVYNKRYWKVPLVLAGEGYMIYNLSNKLKSYRDYNDCNIALVNGETNPPICNGVTSTSTSFSNAQSARSDKELAWVFMGLAHLLNVFDAFIDRHLINFDTSEDLSLIQNYHQPNNLSQPITFIRISLPLN